MTHSTNRFAFGSMMAAGGVGIDRLVERDDAAEGGERVAVPREVEGVGELAGRRRAARVVVLHDHARRPGELAGEVQRRVEVEDVVVTQFLAVQLLGGRRRRGGSMPGST